MKNFFKILVIINFFLIFNYFNQHKTHQNVIEIDNFESVLYDNIIIKDLYISGEKQIKHNVSLYFLHNKEKGTEIKGYFWYLEKFKLAYNKDQYWFYNPLFNKKHYYYCFIYEVEERDLQNFYKPSFFQWLIPGKSNENLLVKIDQYQVVSGVKLPKLATIEYENVLIMLDLGDAKINVDKNPDVGFPKNLKGIYIKPFF